jgi:hypothetical protein
MRRIAFLILLLGSSAFAEAPLRHGFVLGLSLGAGMNDAGSMYGGGGGDLHLGVMLGQHFALLGEVSLVATSYTAGATLVHGVVGLSGRLYFADRFWAEAGLGMGHASADGATFPDSTLAFELAAGVEVVQRRSMALDVVLREATTLYSPAVNSFLAGVGLSWF